MTAVEAPAVDLSAAADVVNSVRTMLRGSVQTQLTKHLLDDPADFRRNDAVSELLIVLDDLDGL